MDDLFWMNALRDVIPAAGDIDFDHPTVRPAGWAVSIPLPAKFQSRPTTNLFRKPVPEGRKNPEPGTGVPGKESNGNQVPFRGRHNQLDHKSLQNPSANQSRKGRKNPEPGTGVPGKEATETKSPLGDGTTLVRLHFNLKSMFFRQQFELFREIHSAVMVFLIHNILPDGGHLGPADATGEISLLPFETRATVFLHPSR